jgi:hypothetical protein
MSSDEYDIIKKAYTCEVGGNMAHISNLDDKIKHDIEYKIAFAPSLFFYLIDCMFTYLMLKLIDEFRKNNNLNSNSRQIKTLQIDINTRFCTNTLSALKWCVENCRFINGDYSCQVAPFETPKQVEDASHAEDNESPTQKEAWELRDEESSKDYSKNEKTVVETNIKAGFTKPAGGGRMIRNKSSVRNHVTRKRQNKQSKQNKQNKQKRKTKRRITRRTTRKRQRQCKRRRTKKRN